MVRETSWWTLGLLSEGEVSVASAALDAVLSHQYMAPGRVWHGTFRRTPLEPEPPDGPEIWRDYDPNWRQFIGTALALALLRFDHALDDPLVARMESAVRAAVAGEPPDRVAPAYSNIALMRAWLDGFAGARFGDAGAAERGESLARAVVARFDSFGAFDEYGSPTYYGVDLYALALWRSHPWSDWWRSEGERLDAALWADIAAHYHAVMRNMCGPFDRAYGMDMREYVSLAGLWINDAVGEAAPLRIPPPAHRHDMCMLPVVQLLGSRVPSQAREHLLEFGGERLAEQCIDDERVATSWLSDAVIVGAEHACGRRAARGQYHPATIHWLKPDGSVGWIRARSEAPLDAVARPGELEILCAGPVGFESSEQTDYGGDLWELDGLRVDVSRGGSRVLLEIR
jgi:hypothetical protein